jgi:RHS repeat-associated protein
MLLEDTILPDTLSPAGAREASRALKGSILRVEVYALDEKEESDRPYTVAERSYQVREIQPRGENRHAVCFAYPRETIDFHYERKLYDISGESRADPRVTHNVTLAMDAFGNVLKSATIGHGRRFRDPDPQLTEEDHKKQEQILLTYNENSYTNPILETDSYRTPLPCESRTYELVKLEPDSALSGVTNLFWFDKLQNKIASASDGLHDLNYEDTNHLGAIDEHPYRRLIEHVRTLYRKDDLTALLPLGEVKPLALPGETYKLASLRVCWRRSFSAMANRCCQIQPVCSAVRVSTGAGTWTWMAMVTGGFHRAGFFSTSANDSAAQELAYAQSHFFLPHRYRDPFHAESIVTYDGYDLLMLETRDALGNRVTVGERLPNGDLDLTKTGNDYRVLQPRLVMNPNSNRAAVAFDAIGMVVGTALMGKPSPAPVEGDSLEGFETDLIQAQIDGFYDIEDPHGPAPNLLKGATTRIIYDLDRFLRTRQAHPEDPTKWLPAYAATVARETHVSDPLPPQGLKIQISFSYSDGFGREIQKKIQAEPGPLVEGGPVISPRWVGSGWSIFNNKGKPVRQYEPFFSATHRFEFDVKIGVSPVLFYDPVERIVATLHPNHTYEKVLFDPWQQKTYDVNDTVLVDPRTDSDIRGYTAGYFAGLPASPPAPPWQTWHAQRQGGALGAQEQAAATKAAAHADTPTRAYFDTLGRPFLTIAHNRFERDNAIVEEKYPTRVELDIEGNHRAVRDAIEQNGDALGRIVMRYDYDMLGNRVHQASMEAGERWMLNDIAGNPIRAWDSRGHNFRTEYDSLRRPLRSLVTGADPANPNQELLTERVVYGEQHPKAEQHNLRGALYLHLDQAGAVITEALDFKGNPLRPSRRIAKEYKRALNWSVVDAVLPSAIAPLDPATLEAALVPLLESDTYESSTTYDALNRPTQLIAPHSDQADTKVNVIQPIYNEANLLEQVHAWLNQNAEPGGWLDPATATLHAVSNIDYNAKGQRTLIEYGSKGVTTNYTYDPLTFRLVKLKSTRTNVPANERIVQDLSYTYDPVGNITHIQDDADIQNVIFFKNKRVEPSADYTYDALYRLIEGRGREHLGQVGGSPIPHSYNDAPRVGVLHPGDGNAMDTYVERYVYDAVGNILEMQHRGSNPSHPGWTRTYTYEETSLIENGTGGTLLKTSNRLSSTTVGNGNPIAEPYVHNAHGSMIQMPHLPLMQWDFEDGLQTSAQQVVTNGSTPETTYYVYDAAGERVHKVTERQNGTRKEERIYLGGFEVYREYNGSGSTIELERETLHIMDDQQRVALVETRTVDTAGDDPGALQLIRYQFGNHLGSASLELDDKAHLISYEEYYPYGSTSFQAVDKAIKAAAKRYRYTGKERDEETGLYYHGARYYAPWLGRWTSADAAGLVDGSNVYTYARHNPILFSDVNGEQASSEWGTDKSKLLAQVKGEAPPEDFPDELVWVPPSERPKLNIDVSKVKFENDEGKPVPFNPHWYPTKSPAPPPPELIEPPDLGEVMMSYVATTAFDLLTWPWRGNPEGAAPIVQRREQLRLWIYSSPEVAQQGEDMEYLIAMASLAYGVGTAGLKLSSQFSRLAGSGTRAATQLEESLTFYRVPGQKTVNATAQENVWYLEKMVAENREYSISTTFSGDELPLVGKPTSVGVYLGPNIRSTVHGHPVSKVALYSDQDLAVYTFGGYRARTEHGVLGLKWPHTYRVAEELGIEAPTDVVKTVITTKKAATRGWAAVDVSF